MVDRDMQAQLKGWSLTTAEIMYRMPDYRDLLQTFIWQNYDSRAAVSAPHRLPELLGAQSRRAAAHGTGDASGPGVRSRDAVRRLGMAAALRAGQRE